MGQVGSSIGSSDVPVPKEGLKNLDGKPKMDQSTSLMSRPGQPVSLAYRLNQLEAEFKQKIEEIKTQTSRSSKDQDEKIAIIRVRERNLAQLLNQTREEMAGLKTQNRDQSKRIDQLEQKLAKLVNTPPTSPLLKRGNTKEKMKNGASIPPSSCQELAILDYHLDGLYLVKNKETKKIQTVFCKFSEDDKVSQDVIGTVDVKTKSVHFYVQRNSGFSAPKVVIPFDVAPVNVGNAFNLPSGVFTVPVPGIYHFQLSAVKARSLTSLNIHLEVNGVNVGVAYTWHSDKMNYDTVSLSASLRLAANDRVTLLNWGDSTLYDNQFHQTHFSGWLVEEDL